MMSVFTRIALIVLFLVGLAGSWLYPRLSVWHEDKPLNPTVILNGEPDCDPAKKICVAHNEEISLSLSLQGPVRVLTPFAVTVRLDESAAWSSTNHIAVTFSMVGMTMGLNRFMLKQQDPRTWQGQAMLPVCSSGRTDWRILVEVAGDQQYATEFVTLVIR